MDYQRLLDEMKKFARTARKYHVPYDEYHAEFEHPKEPGRIIRVKIPLAIRIIESYLRGEE